MAAIRRLALLAVDAGSGFRELGGAIRSIRFARDSNGSAVGTLNIELYDLETQPVDQALLHRWAESCDEYSIHTGLLGEPQAYLCYLRDLVVSVQPGAATVTLALDGRYVGPLSAAEISVTETQVAAFRLTRPSAAPHAPAARIERGDAASALVTETVLPHKGRRMINLQEEDS